MKLEVAVDLYIVAAKENTYLCQTYCRPPEVNYVN